ncbi:putative extracellular threonine rich protein [Planoprotostelium fungivorum]|uniref:Putative extracellular threonine rich protein n=1 Tax=Planoprotostelium fungivorum TaxID=1890364 RepID=A0A2P6NHV5_9EUKA|nr:putative extracellular threonine rich protein [Planoprotostelium fungivorum]
MAKRAGHSNKMNTSCGKYPALSRVTQADRRGAATTRWKLTAIVHHAGAAPRGSHATRPVGLPFPFPIRVPPGLVDHGRPGPATTVKRATFRVRRRASFTNAARAGVVTRVAPTATNAHPVCPPPWGRASPRSYPAKLPVRVTATTPNLRGRVNRLCSTGAPTPDRPVTTDELPRPYLGNPVLEGYSEPPPKELKLHPGTNFVADTIANEPEGNPADGGPPVLNGATIQEVLPPGGPYQGVAATTSARVAAAPGGSPGGGAADEDDLLRTRLQSTRPTTPPWCVSTPCGSATTEDEIGPGELHQQGGEPPEKIEDSHELTQTDPTPATPEGIDELPRRKEQDTLFSGFFLFYHKLSPNRTTTRTRPQMVTVGPPHNRGANPGGSPATTVVQGNSHPDGVTPRGHPRVDLTERYGTPSLVDPTGSPRDGHPRFFLDHPMGVVNRVHRGSSNPGALSRPHGVPRGGGHPPLVRQPGTNTNGGKPLRRDPSGNFRGKTTLVPRARATQPNWDTRVPTGIHRSRVAVPGAGGVGVTPVVIYPPGVTPATGVTRDKRPPGPTVRVSGSPPPAGWG